MLIKQIYYGIVIIKQIYYSNVKELIIILHIRCKAATTQHQLVTDLSPDFEECICNQTDALLQCMPSIVGWKPSNACSSRGRRVALSDWSWGLNRYWLSQGLTACNQYKQTINFACINESLQPVGKGNREIILKTFEAWFKLY